MTRLTAALIVVAVLGGGCVSENALDPTGTDFSVSAEWTIDGETPSPAVCAASGIEQVRVAFYEGSLPHYVDALEFCCSEGSFSTDRILAYAHYRVELQAHDLHRSGSTTADATDETALIADPPQTHVDLTPDGPVDFVYDGGDVTGLRVTASWTVAGAPASGDTCTAAGIDTVAVRAYAESDTAFSDPVFERTAPCSEGSLDSKDAESDPTPLPNGARYRLETAALDSSGAAVGRARTDQVVDASCVARLEWPAADLP